MCMRAQLRQSCLTLCHPVDCSPPGRSVHETLQAKILEWVTALSSRGSSWWRDQAGISCSAGDLFTAEPSGKPLVRYWCLRKGFPVAQMIKNLPAMQAIWVRSLSWDDPLMKRMATHSRITLQLFSVLIEKKHFHFICLFDRLFCHQRKKQYR